MSKLQSESESIESGLFREPESKSANSEKLESELEWESEPELTNFQQLCMGFVIGRNR